MVHGIGEAVRGQTAATLAESLAKSVARQRARPDSDVTVTPAAGVWWGQSDPDGKAGSPDAGAARVCDLSWHEGERQQTLRVYEFYWANRRRPVRTILTGLVDLWQFFVGLPRLGYHSLKPSPPGHVPWLRPSSPHPACGEEAPRGLAAVRFLFFAAWTAMLIRLLSVIVTACLHQLGVAVSPLRLAEIQLVFEIPVWITFLGLSVSIVLLLVSVRRREMTRLFRRPLGTLRRCRFRLFWPPLRPRRRYRFRLAPAVVALAAAQLLLASLEQGISEIAFPVKGLAPDPAPWFPTLEYTTPDGAGRITAMWFFSPNTLPGFWPVLNMGLLVLGLILGVGWYLVRARGSGASPKEVAGRVNRGLTLACLYALAVGWSVVLVTPLLSLVDLVQVLTGALPTPLFEPSDTLVLVYKAMALPLVATTAGLVVSGRVRAVAAPLFGLALDVIHYFPAIDRIDRYAGLRLLYGGQFGSGDVGPRDALAEDLAALIRRTHLLHRDRVVVIGHSLGSVIALTALERLSADKAMSAASVELVTLGSPLAVLGKAYPSLFGGERPPWTLSVVARWHNLYRAADLVGREVPAVVGASPQPENDNIGRGGHTGYFGDPELARRVVGQTT